MKPCVIAFSVTVVLLVIFSHSPAQAEDGMQWSNWSSWSKCDVQCGAGTIQKKRSRDCNLFYNCRDSISDECYNECPPGWVTWKDWSSCAGECGTKNGTRTREKQCYIPQSGNYSKEELCPGESHEEKQCTPCSSSSDPDDCDGCVNWYAIAVPVLVIGGTFIACLVWVYLAVYKGGWDEYPEAEEPPEDEK